MSSANQSRREWSLHNYVELTALTGKGINDMQPAKYLICTSFMSNYKEVRRLRKYKTPTDSCSTSRNQLFPPHSCDFLFLCEFIRNGHILTNVNDLQINRKYKKCVRFLSTNTARNRNKLKYDHIFYFSR